ncbi:MAG: hypothetical protein EB088_13765, partial [Betaproteobacteria bacterium]|nr:hypothetical protein [Betaproteobacteria bacterium]
EHHDKTRFETYAFSLGIDDGSSLRRRFKLGFDHFIDCKEKTATEIASLIRAAEIDVLVDLAGYTAGSKSEIFAMRPAPAHVNFLGYPGTMGASWMDYLIADPVVIPAGSERFYQEKVLRLPHCYLPADDSIQIAARKPSRAECGLGAKRCSVNICAQRKLAIGSSDIAKSASGLTKRLPAFKPSTIRSRSAS